MPRSSKLERLAIEPLNNRLSAIEALQGSGSISRSSTPPPNPVLGDIWQQTGKLTWAWDGSYWLSRQIFRDFFVVANFSSTAYTFVFPVDPEFNLFLLNLSSVIRTSNNNTVTTFWNWDFARITQGSTATNLLTFNSINQIANVWRQSKYPLNLHINVAATSTVALQIAETRSGNTSKYGTITIEYKKAYVPSI